MKTNPADLTKKYWTNKKRKNRTRNKIAKASRRRNRGK